MEINELAKSRFNKREDDCLVELGGEFQILMADG